MILYVCNGVNSDVTNLDFMDFFANDVIQKMVMTGKKEEVDKVLKANTIKPHYPIKLLEIMGILKFTDMGKEWGFAQPSFSNGLLMAIWIMMAIWTWS